jgi:import inner membrane translocase subunit TIM21
MLRSAANLSLRQSSRVAVALTGRSTAFRLAPTTAGKSWLQSQELRFVPNSHWSRAFSSQSNGGAKEKQGGDDDDDTKEIVLTPGQQVVAVSRLGMWVGIIGFALVCGYYIAKELIPTKMSPNTVFNRASKVIRSHAAVTRQYGDSLKFYGKDHGGHREGRRNFIEHTEYTNEDDGSKRTRVRFNMEGQFNNAICFAEVSNAMPSGEFVYILVQDKRTGRVVTVADNRAALTAQRLAGGNKDTANAMQQLLGGASKSG